MVPIITIAEPISKNIARLDFTIGFPFNLIRIIINRISPRKPPKMLNSSIKEKLMWSHISGSKNN
jgi:hypothetical protein